MGGKELKNLHHMATYNQKLLVPDMADVFPLSASLRHTTNSLVNFVSCFRAAVVPFPSVPLEEQ